MYFVRWLGKIEMATTKFKARIHVEIDYKAKRAVLVLKEEGREDSKILLNADVAYSVGHTLEAYALMLKQSEKEEQENGKSNT